MLQSQQSQQGPSLSIVAHGASNLKDVELIGKQDPYLRFTLDITNPKSFQKTFVHKNAGKNPVWNQSFNIPIDGEPELYIEIMDEETTADGVIAFAAIPINQVVHAPGGTLNGVFDVFTTDGKQNGEINLTLSAQNVPGQNTGYQSGASGNPVKGQSHIVEAHQKRVKSIKNKEIAADTGLAVAGGLFALGAGLLANKAIGDEKKKEEARKEAARQAEEEHEQFEGEKKKFAEERSTFERTQSEERSKLERQQQESRTTQETSRHTERREEHREERHEERREERREEHHGEHHGHNKHGNGREWDPVGNYSAGDKVRYHDREYICLQGHQSNPTWEPTQAHSLWRAD